MTGVTLTVGDVQSVNMNTWQPFPVTTSAPDFGLLSPTEIQMWNGFLYDLSGSGFTWDTPDAQTVVLTGGTVTGLDVIFPTTVPQLVYSFTSLNIPLTDLVALSETGTQNFNASIFGGDDTITGAAGPDFLYGYGGNDTIDGGGSDDLLDGGDGNDNLTGGDGNDSLYGQNGDDSLFGSGGDDKLYGGAGNNALDGGPGQDTVSYKDSPGGVTIDLRLPTITNFSGGQDTLTSVDIIEGSNYDDQFIGDSGDNAFYGLNGNNTYDLSAGGHDIVKGSGGDDTIYMGASLDPLDSIWGYNYDSIGDGTNTVILDGDYSAGLNLSGTLVWIDDVILMPGHSYNLNLSIQSAGPATLDGSQLTASNSLTYQGYMDIVYGGAGNDTITFTGSSLGGGAQVHLEAGGDDTVSLSIFGGDVYFGDAYTSADIISSPGVPSKYHFDGAYANGTVLYGQNVSRVYFAAGHSYNFVADAGLIYTTVDATALQTGQQLTFDASALVGVTMLTGAGNDVLTGSGGADIFHGGAGDDSITANAGADDLYGDAGNDTLNGGGENDRIYGGPGIDTAVFSGSRTSYTIIRGWDETYVTGPDGADTLLGVEKLQFDDAAVLVGQGSLSTNFNSDLEADILWQNDNGQAAIWMMNGLSRLAGSTIGSSPGTSWHVKGAADFSGDGYADILWQDESGQAAIWTMNGFTRIGATLMGGNPGSSWHIAGIGDFFGYGNPDILWQNDNGQAAIWEITRFDNGFYQITGRTVGGNPGTAWHVIGAADFNGDGRSDILWQNDNGQAAIWIMGDFMELRGGVLGTSPGSDWHVVDAGDFNGDGKADILWQNDSGQAAIWLMDGLTRIGAGLVGSNPGPSWHVKGAADFNGDGFADILWQNDSGQAAIWTMDGLTRLGAATLGASPGASWHIIASPS